MFFKDEYLINISNLISIKYKFYAHLNSEKDETIEEHTNRTFKYFKNIIRAKRLDDIFLNFESYYFENNNEKELFREIMIGSILFHDIGKINPNFQNLKMNNNLNNNEQFSKLGSQHSIISAVLYIDYYLDKVIKSRSLKLVQILLLNSYIISKHHSNLGSFYKYLNKFELDENGYEVIKIFSTYNSFYNKEFSLSVKKIKTILNGIKKIENSKEDSIYLYAYTKLLYSLLLASDFYATSEFITGTELNDFGNIDDIDDFYSLYKDTELYKKIRNYESNHYNKLKDFSKEKNINVLRTELFLDAEKELIKNIKEDIFFLEAPTGSGKSNVSLNLGFKLLEKDKDLRKIYYIYPFNTLIDQNMNSLRKIFDSNKKVLKKISIINSVYPIKMDKEEENQETYSKALLDRQFLNYPIVLSTHVSLFDTMFNNSKESAFSFHQLANSVIILDEIQSYKNTIWTEIIEFLKVFSKMLNIKIIIMSATLPDLAFLLNSKENIVDLISKREKYFNNDLFKRRVKTNYELLNSKDIINDLHIHIKKNSKNNKKIIIEFIKKESAYKFYNILKEDNEIKCKVELITGDDNYIERERIINIISSKESLKNGIILISTQVIEAGVDIDMDIGYKDISKLDSEEQLAGRINRSAQRQGVLYIFNLDNTEQIYKNDIRSQARFTLVENEIREIFENKDFNKYYSKILHEIKEVYNNSLNDSNLENFFINEVGKFDYKKVAERMNLIDNSDWKMSIYLSRILKDNNQNEIDGSKIWNEYYNLLNENNIDYSEKQVKLSEIRSKMNYFIYEVNKNDNLTYDDRIGELYFIKDGEKYFNNGKLDI